MKTLTRSTILLFTFLVIGLSGNSQITVTKIETGSENISNEGFIYTLPKTIIKVNIVYEEITEIAGPLADYTTEYLGTNNFIGSNNTSYKVINIAVDTDVETDENNMYYVQYPIERSKDEKSTSFTLSNIGGLLAYNTEPQKQITNSEIITDQTFIFESGNKQFQYMPKYNRQKKIDTVIRTINIDTVTINRFLFNTTWIDKSIEDKAKDAALQIEKIRESRFHLITGYQEINYGSSMAYMDKQLQIMENEYLELFLGKVVKSVKNHTVYFIPSKVKKTDELLKFENGNSITIRITPDVVTSSLSQTANSQTNKIFYQIPASTQISVNYNNSVIFSDRFLINQLGSISTVTLVNTKLQFNKTTGNLISISRE